MGTSTRTLLHHFQASAADTHMSKRQSSQLAQGKPVKLLDLVATTNLLANCFEWDLEFAVSEKHMLHCVMGAHIWKHPGIII